MAVDVLAGDYVRMLKKLRTIDRKIKRAYMKRIREAAGPLGRHVLTAGSDKMPSRGGLRAKLRASQVTTTVREGGVDIWAGNRRRSQFGRINRLGRLRHPVWNRGGWSDQKVLAGTYSEAFLSLPADDRERLAKVLTDITKELA